MSNIFETEISRSLKKLPGWSQKLATPAAAGNAEQRFNLTTEFDFLYMSKGHNIAFECKKIERERFPFTMVKEHQETGLQKFLDVGHAYILVNFRLTKKVNRNGKTKKYSRVYKAEERNRAFAVHITDYLAGKEYALAGDFGRNRKSLRMEWFADNAIELERVPGRKAYWDLSPLLGRESNNE